MSCFKNKGTGPGFGSGRMEGAREGGEPKMTETQSGYGALFVFIDSRPTLKHF